MTDPNNISNELNELQSQLAGFGRPGEGFTVPQGYFEGFAESMLAKAKALDGLAGQPGQVAPLPGISAAQPDTAAETARAGPLEELAGLSPLLAGIPKHNIYAVPAGYFDELDPMAPNLEQELSPLLAGLKKKQPFTVPEGFFEKISIPDTAGRDPFSPVLERIGRELPYTVPAGYFASLDPVAAIGAQPAKLISMGSFKWKRYAAAACIAAIISLGTIFYFSRNGSQDNTLAFDKIPTQTIINLVGESENQVVYAMTSSDEDVISQLVKNVPDKEIQAFLNETETAESDMDDDPLLN